MSTQSGLAPVVDRGAIMPPHEPRGGAESREGPRAAKMPGQF